MVDQVLQVYDTVITFIRGNKREQGGFVVTKQLNWFRQQLEGLDCSSWNYFNFKYIQKFCECSGWFYNNQDMQWSGCLLCRLGRCEVGFFYIYTLSHREWEKKGNLSDFKQRCCYKMDGSVYFYSLHLYSSLRIGLTRENIQQFSILLISEVKGEWADCFKLARQQ